MIQVSAPKFELYEQVVLYWNEEEYSTAIVRRWLDLEDSYPGQPHKKDEVGWGKVKQVGTLQ